MRSSTVVECPVCSGPDYVDVLSLPPLPVLINAQVRPDEAANVVRGPMDLVACVRCAHLFNRSFDSGLLDYDSTYENSLHFSARFREFATELCDRLVVTHGLVGSRVAELGSGPGHFLSMLCEAGVVEGFGFDPSYDACRLGAPDHPAVTISTKMFPDDGSLQVSMAFSQHVLEHLAAPVEALVAQRRAVEGDSGLVYSEVPNGLLMIEATALWDLIYEHRSYFLPTSLDLACRAAGLGVDAIGSAFADQFLWCEARPDPGVDDGVDAQRVAHMLRAAETFGHAARSRIEIARRELSDWATLGPVALWGAGSKGATYLNLTNDLEAIAAVVDINPRKAGWGVPGTSLEIVEPEALAAIGPRTVLVANPVYLSEISAQLQALGVDANVVPLWSDEALEGALC